MPDPTNSESVPQPADPQQPPLAPHDPTGPGPQDRVAARIHQQRELLAVGIALQSRVLMICHRHHHIYCDAGADLSAAFSLALQAFRRGGPEAHLFENDEHALLDLLSVKIGEADDHCPRCLDVFPDYAATERSGGAAREPSYA
jgi:hypothetical protein